MVKFFCKLCFNESKAENYDAIVKCEKICIDCINKERDEKNRLKKEKNKKNYKKKETKIKSSICEFCNNPFEQTGSAKYCSPQCKKKGIENKRFYSGLKTANTAIALSKVKVYGNGSSQHMDNTFLKGNKS